MAADIEVIETRLAMLAEHVSDLKALQEITFDEYQSNKILRGYMVHNHARVDNAIVYGILKRHLGDFDRFARLVTGFLEDQSS